MALVVIVIVPEAVPLATGVKVTVNVACPPAAIVCPAVNPLLPNPLPEVVT